MRLFFLFLSVYFSVVLTFGQNIKKSNDAPKKQDPITKLKQGSKPAKQTITKLKETTTKPTKQTITKLKEGSKSTKQTITKLKEKDKPAKQTITKLKEGSKPAKSTITKLKEKDKPAKSMITKLKEGSKPAKQTITKLKEKNKPVKETSTKLKEKDAPSLNVKDETVTPPVITKNVTMFYDEIQGYRVQIFYDNGNDAKEKAMDAKRSFLEKNPNTNAYLLYDMPDFKVRVGDFPTKEAATEFQDKINKDYPSSMVVPDIVTYSMDKKVIVPQN